MRNEFLQLIRDNVERAGIEELLEWLEKSDFYSAPASSRFHLAKEGGLVEHSMNVYYRLLRLYEMEYGEITQDKKETLAIISLLHDLCKINFYKVDFKNAKNEKGVWEKVPYYAVDERFAYGYHGAKSTFLIERFIKLTLEEAVCVSNHMGAYDRPQNDYSLTNAYNQYPLALLLHTADCLATTIDEKE